MMTVKDISRLTGISARTLHYYDEIGLFTPTEKSEAGYRLYDDKALETLQQILFFREFDIPLKEIKAVMSNPSLDRSSILSMQKKMLIAKKERLERLIASIDNVLKGDKEMDFSVFNETDIQTMYDSMVENMNDEMKEVFITQYGSMDTFKEDFLKNAGSEQAQKNFAKLVEWYGDKEAVLEASQNPAGSEVFTSYQKRMGAIQEKLAGMIGTDVGSYEVRALIGEYEFISKHLYQMSDVKPLLLEMAKEYQNNKEVQSGIDSVYGAGATAYLGKALEAYYKR